MHLRGTVVSTISTFQTMTIGVVDLEFPDGILIEYISESVFKNNAGPDIVILARTKMHSSSKLTSECWLEVFNESIQDSSRQQVC